MTTILRLTKTRHVTGMDQDDSGDYISCLQDLSLSDAGSMLVRGNSGGVEDGNDMSGGTPGEGVGMYSEVILCFRSHSEGQMTGRCQRRRSKGYSSSYAHRQGWFECLRD